MPTNDFIGFASAGSANIMSQADYAAAAEQTDGVQPGPASSLLANKIWRQGANMASAIGEALIDYGHDALDNGDIATLKQSIVSAFAMINAGTWTPTIDSSTAGAVTYTGTSANYIKIGNLVYCYIVGSLFVNNASGSIRLVKSTLPYTPVGWSLSGTFRLGSKLSLPYIAYTGNLYFTDLDTQTNMSASAFTANNSYALYSEFSYVAS